MPLVDGSGGVKFLCRPDFPDERRPRTAANCESRSIRILRPYENANCLIFDTPIIRRSDSPDHEVLGHRRPIFYIVPPDKVDFRLVQYAYYRNPAVPTAMIAEFTMNAKKDGIQARKRRRYGFSLQMGKAWGIRQNALCDCPSRRQLPCKAVRGMERAN